MLIECWQDDTAAQADIDDIAAETVSEAGIAAATDDTAAGNFAGAGTVVEAGTVAEDETVALAVD